ncbi:MAG TPA: hypothetical protein VK721_12850 [Solirubrobacteraceae bacterium]|nr:hypothetical protein [Solirubrobacteraceae bacterium]
MEVQDVADANQVSTGGEHTCALLSSGHIECWSDNAEGQLGNGTIISSETPVEVEGITDATEVSAWQQHACALLATGHIECCGTNLDGILGTGRRGTASSIPVEVSGI